MPGALPGVNSTEREREAETRGRMQKTPRAVLRLRLRQLMLTPLLGPLAGPDEFPIQFQGDGRRLVNVDLLHVPCKGTCTHARPANVSLSTALLLKQRRCLWVGKTSHCATRRIIDSCDCRNTKLSRESEGGLSLPLQVELACPQASQLELHSQHTYT